MKVRVYDSGLKSYIDRYTLYFPYPKKMRKEYMEMHRSLIMGFCIPFSFSSGDYRGTTINRCASFEDDRTLGYDVPNREKKVKIVTLPKEVQEWCANMERIWNDALKYDDKEHWDAWLYA